MLDRNEYYLEILDYPKEELFSIANKCTALLLHLAKDELSDDKNDLPYDVIIDLVFMYAFYDEYVTNDKAKLIKDLFDIEMSDSELLDFAKDRMETAKEREKFLDKLRIDEEFTDTEFLLGLCIYALDGEITRDEQTLLERNTRKDIIKYKKGNA